MTRSHGVTFLAFGNGAPDIFSAVVAFSDPRTAGLAIGALFGEYGPGRGAGSGASLAEPGRCPPGAGVLVTTVVAGGIAILHPFLAASRPFLRDIAFYMAAVFLTFTALYLGRVTLAWALGEQAQGTGAIPGVARSSETQEVAGGVEGRLDSRDGANRD